MDPIDARLRRWLEAAWWLAPWVAAAACLSVFWSHATPHLCYRSYWLAGDAGITVYNAWQVADGRVLYRDVFEFKTPLFFYLWGGLLRVFGPSPSVAQWATLACMSAVAPIGAVVLHRLGARRLFAGVAATLTVVLCFAVWPFPFTPWLGWLMLALSAWSLERASRGGVEPDRGWLLRAGAFAGLLVLTIQSLGIPFAAGATVALLLAIPARPWRHVGWFVGGGLAVAAPWVAYFAIQGVLGDALWQTFVWPAKHYYNGFIKGNYPGAGVVEHFQRRGACAGSASRALDHAYTATVAGVPALTAVAFLACAALVGRLVWRRLRRRPGATSPRELVVAVIAAAGFLTFLPGVVKPSLSDLPHLSFAGLAVTLPFLAAAATGPRAWRVGAQAFVFLLAAATAAAYVDRHLSFQPFAKKYRRFDDHVKRYANAGWLEQMTEPGDTIVHVGYGGWQYLMSRRHSGIAHTTVFIDDRYTPDREWRRIMTSLAQRQPTIMVFGEKRHEVEFFRRDPSLRDRYFWNGAAWERRSPPLVAVSLAPVYRVVEGGRPGDELVLEQKGQELAAVRRRAGAPDRRLVGSVRGGRVWLVGGGESLLARVQPDGRLVGECRGGGPLACRLDPIGAAP